jgi:hypothetical protein
LPDSAGQYAKASLERLRSSLSPSIDQEDLAALDLLLGSGGPEGILQRSDLSVRATRTVWAATRPPI